MSRLVALAQARICASSLPVGYSIAAALVVICASTLAPYVPPSLAAGRLEDLAGHDYWRGYDFMQYFSTVGLQLQELSTPRNLFLLLNGIIVVLLASSHVQVHARRRPAKARKNADPQARGRKAEEPPLGIAENPSIIDEAGIASIMGDGGGVEYYAGNAEEEGAVAAAADPQLAAATAPSTPSPISHAGNGEEEEAVAVVAAASPLLISHRSSSQRRSQAKNPLGVINNPRSDARSIEATWRAISFDSGRAAQSKSNNSSLKRAQPYRKAETLPIASFTHRDQRDPALHGSFNDGPSPLTRTLSSSSNPSANNNSNKKNSFKVHAPPPKSARVRREPSITQEELNAKVESFISRFNQQIRLERQESLLRYKEMVDRGAS